MTPKNTNPYYDDFSDSNNFHQILFKPGYAVQARELTQIQSILKDQIAKFGNHIFKHGSVVIPGNSISDLAVPYVKFTTTSNILSFVGQTVVGSVSGVEAVVKLSVAPTATEPAMFYLTYISGNSAGNVLFQAGEVIYLKSTPSISVTSGAVDAVGVGSVAFINRGVYYINGTFVTVLPQSIVISKYTSAPSCHVLLKINEEIITSTEDDTLLDPAQGSYNYAAPGADRAKITLELVSIPLGGAITEDYVEIMRFNDGELEEHSKNAKYSELEKSLARRTFDESGDYVVDGLVPTVREHLKQGPNNGVFANGDSSKLVVDTTPGKAYINGFEVEKFSNTKVVINKARTSSHIKETGALLRPEYGQYMLISNMVGTLSISDHEVVSFYNDNDQTNVSATLVGSARVIGIDYEAGDVSTGAIYKLWVTDITLATGYTIDAVGGIRYGGTKSATVLAKYFAPISAGSFTVGEFVSHPSGRTATVKYWDIASSSLYAFKHNHLTDSPAIGDKITGSVSTTTSVIGGKTLITSIGQSGLVFRLTKPVVYSLKGAVSLAYNLSYTVQKEFTIVTNSAGGGDTSVSSGETISPIEVGSFIAVGPAGVLANSMFSINVAGTILSITGGPISSTVKIYASVLKSGVSPKTKTLTTSSTTITSPTAKLTLNKADLVSVISVIDSVGDITANYNVFNGQNDYAYNVGYLTLKSGKPAPVGNVVVTFSYYEHSISGDFFCVDSYSGSIQDTKTVYSSNTTGQVYDLASSIDFRSTVGADNEFTGANSRRNSLVLTGTTFNTNLQYYVPRIDVLTLDVSGKVNVISGIPSETPTAPNVPTSQFAVNMIYVPAYTKTAADVSMRRLSVERFTMNDIKAISNRVTRVEDFATLTAAELSVTSKEVLDAATGLNKFKTGYLVEDFSNPLTIARSTSGDYAAMFVGTELHARMESLDCVLDILGTSTGFVDMNGVLMLPFTEEVFAQQTLSSRVTNLNPFLVIRWDGVLSVNPPSDSWVDVTELPTIFESLTENVIVNEYAYISCPPDPVVIILDPVVVTPTPRPPLPETTFGGWYGQVAGRAGESGGVNYWTAAVTSGEHANLAAAFLYSAEANYKTADYTKNYESVFNPTSIEALTANPVLTSTTTNAYVGNSIVATTSGINVDGTTFTNSTLVQTF